MSLGVDIRHVARLARTVQAVGELHVDAQQLAEVRVEVLPVALRISTRATVAGPDVEHAVGPELDHPTVMVRVGLPESQDDLLPGRVASAILIGADP